MANIRKLAVMALGMAAMAEAGMQDVYEITNPYYCLPSLKLVQGPRKFRVKDEKAFANKVEKRRKKNKNKKTHRK